MSKLFQTTTKTFGRGRLPMGMVMRRERERVYGDAKDGREVCMEKVVYPL
jgi:hypothetical protein